TTTSQSPVLSRPRASAFASISTLATMRPTPPAIAAEPSLRPSTTCRILALSTAFAKRSSVVPMGPNAAFGTALADTRGRTTVGVSTPNLVLATVGIIAFAVVYYLVLWIYVVPLGPIVLALAFAARRLWSGARRRHDYLLLLNPVRREQRLYLWQAL